MNTSELLRGTLRCLRIREKIFLFKKNLKFEFSHLKKIKLKSAIKLSTSNFFLFFIFFIFFLKSRIWEFQFPNCQCTVGLSQITMIELVNFLSQLMLNPVSETTISKFRVAPISKTTISF